MIGGINKLSTSTILWSVPDKRLTREHRCTLVDISLKMKNMCHWKGRCYFSRPEYLRDAPQIPCKSSTFQIPPLLSSRRLFSSVQLHTDRVIWTKLGQDLPKESPMWWSSPHRGVSIFLPTILTSGLILPTFFIPIRCTAQGDRVHTPITRSESTQRQISILNVPRVLNSGQFHLVLYKLY